MNRARTRASRVAPAAAALTAGCAPAAGQPTRPATTVQRIADDAVAHTADGDLQGRTTDDHVGR